jgi:hypothetical protein
MIYRISFILFQSVISITCYFMTCTPWLCLEVPQFSNRTNFASRTKRKKPWTFVAKCNNYNMCPVFGCFIYSGDKFLETITSFFFLSPVAFCQSEYNLLQIVFSNLISGMCVPLKSICRKIMQ